MIRTFTITFVFLLSFSVAAAERQSDEQVAQVTSTQPQILLKDWGKTLAMRSRVRNNVLMCLWFYEWSMFDAVVEGQHTIREKDYPWQIDDDAASATNRRPGMALHVQAVNDGAKLTLRITNRSDHDWPELASLIPCFTPGSIRGDNANVRFIDKEHQRTYFSGAQGLMLLKDREIHFQSALRDQLAANHNVNELAASTKWPHSEDYAVQPIMIREGRDGQWVAGIAWERSVSSQGHNPWECMHLSVQVGPLKRGDTKTIRGRIYLFKGTKEECLQKYQTEFKATSRKAPSND